MADPLLLGLADEQIKSSENPNNDWTISKLGGLPDWLLGPPSTLPSCGLCNRRLPLIAQLYCPLYNSPYHRVMYIFGCPSSSCWNKQQSWQVLRGQVLEEMNTQPTTGEKALSSDDVDDWGDDANDWGESNESNLVMNDLEVAASKLSLQNPAQHPGNDNNTSTTTKFLETSSNSTQQNISADTLETPFFVPYYINVFEDSSNANSSAFTKHERQLLQRYQADEGVNVMDWVRGDLDDIYEAVGGNAGEKYEKESVRHGDKGFHKFHKQLLSCPQQCLRYQWDGTPLFINPESEALVGATGIPICSYCNAPKIFEMQLMPALVSKLHGDKVLSEPLPKQNECLKPGNHSDRSNKMTESSEVAERMCTIHYGMCDSNGILHGSCESSVNHDLEEALRSDNVNIVSDTLCDTDGLRDIGGLCDADGLFDTTRLNIEFGTVMVYACSQSCWDDRSGYRQEFIFVEADPDAHLFFRKTNSNKTDK
ncbi:predicted protein [Nematostella vectensis]|uniref:Programmed cell death protein 2 C-terminal domain-containing protein n=1 Tax=Nematostella vectensis TaxID=45351 RepID=A7T0G3_NEMVE|nr:predicted protein [Nematostella vectensis]|eukprot:XP_001622652.1 predicted protein [Nematostella vectensis]